MRIMDKQFIYNDLKKQILTLQLEPGSSLDEASLCTRYKTSRTPLREILRALAGEGCVDIVNNRGAYVSSMSHKVLRDFFVTAPMIYSAIGQLAANNATAPQLQEMRALWRQGSRTLDIGGSDSTPSHRSSDSSPTAPPHRRDESNSGPSRNSGYGEIKYGQSAAYTNAVATGTWWATSEPTVTIGSFD